MAKLHGVFAPIVTPFALDSGEIDQAWIPQHLAYLENHGCDGIIVCGTNGEAASLSVAERMAVLETACGAAGRLTVVAGTGAAALPDAVALTRHAFASGVNEVLVMPPFYYKRPSDVGVAAWYARLCDAAVPPGGRLLLYHIPQITGVPFTDSLIDLLLQECGDVIYGIKDSTGDPAEGVRIRGRYPQFAYFSGNDRLVAECCLGGGVGSITAGANVFPDLVARVQAAVRENGDVAGAQATLSAARAVLDSVPLQPATKAALALVAGLPVTAVRPPQAELSSQQLAGLQSALRSYLPEWRPA